MGSHAVKRIINYFKEKKFKAGDYLFEEGIIADKAYIIREGECRLTKLKDEILNIPNSLRGGFLSKTTQNYNMGMVIANQWVGEDSLLLTQPMKFSVKCQTFVVAFEITKESLLVKLPKETQHILRQNVLQKQ